MRCLSPAAQRAIHLASAVIVLKSQRQAVKALNEAGWTMSRVKNVDGTITSHATKTWPKPA